MKDKLIAVEQISKTYQKGDHTIDVLKGTSFSVYQGDMISIIGTSGAGKSTLLHVLGTLDIPDRGSILYRGSDLVGLSSSELADFRNKRLGFVFQFHHLLPEFTALENVMMPALIRRTAKREARMQAEAILLRVGLAHRLQHRPGELSGGEQQRVALARALVLEPELLLADEVTGNLDEATGAEIHHLLFELNEQLGVTIIAVTHHRGLAERMPRRLILEEGLVKERV